MFALRLSRTISSSTHFVIRINPYLNFKRDGEFIQYDEQVYFHSHKHNSMIQSVSVVGSSKETAISEGKKKKLAQQFLKSAFDVKEIVQTDTTMKGKFKDKLPFIIERSKNYIHR